MKKISLLFLAILMICCSETESTHVTANQDIQKFPSKITYGGGDLVNTYDLTYDTRHRLRRVVETSDSMEIGFIIVFTYDENDRLILIDWTGEFPLTLEFTYDQDGRLASYIQNGLEPRLVYYDQGVYNMPIGSDNLHAFTEFNDLAMTNNGNTVSYNYSEINYGAFKDVVGNFELFNLFCDHFFRLFATRMPLSSITTTAPVQIIGTFSNIYDAQGYVTNFTCTSSHGQTLGSIIYGE